MQQILTGSVGNNAWELGWDALAAIGTLLAVGVALWISVRDGRARTAARDAESRFSTMLLWSDYRRFLAALNLIRRHEILLRATITGEERTRLQRALGNLHSDLPYVIQFGEKLNQPDSDRIARVLANIRHVYRHANDLQMANGEIGKESYEEKRDAINTCIRRARRDLLPLLMHAKSLVKGAHPEPDPKA